MTASLLDWCARWNIPPQALKELAAASLHLKDAEKTESEARVQSQIRLAAARQGKYLYRNNRGAGKMASGSFVRYGIANDSQALGDAYKSGDLIGWEPVLITAEMAGTIIARFLSVEVKRTDWKFSGSVEECAQLAWCALVNAQGGRAVITNTPDSI